MRRDGDVPRERDPRRDQAFEIYKQHKGKIELVEIASQLAVPQGTIRGWKAKDKWDEKLNGTFRAKKPKNTERSKRAKDPPKKESSARITHSQEDELTYKQKLFCVYYAKCFNATKAYQKAYGCSYDVANAEGWKLLVNPCIKEEINIIKQHKLNRAMLTGDDIFQRYLDIAFADLTDFVEFGTKEVFMRKRDGTVDTITYSYLDLKDSNQIDGTLLSEVTQGKNGISVKLLDKMKALQWLGERLELLPTEIQLGFELESKKLQMAKEKHTKEMGADNKQPIKIEFIKASERSDKA
jgi:phage terminase small subunit